MSSLDRYDNMSGVKLKREVLKRGLPIHQNLAAFKYRIVCRLDDLGKIPESLKYLKPGTNKMPNFYDLLLICHNNPSQIEQDTL